MWCALFPGRFARRAELTSTFPLSLSLFPLLCAFDPRPVTVNPAIRYLIGHPLGPLESSLPPGPQVNGKPYARAGILGKGGSSRVYRVLDEKNNLFAIKKVDISKNDAESRASFINEIHLLEKLRGKEQIIRLVDSEVNDGKKVLLMVRSLARQGIVFAVQGGS